MQPEGNDGSFMQLALSNKGKRKNLKAKIYIFLLSFEPCKKKKTFPPPPAFHPLFSASARLVA
jgi:hypothetical protein